MSKLLSQQLKENIKDISLWMIIPMLMSILLNRINTYFNSQIIDFILVLSIFVMYSSFAIAMVIVILNDYKRFYGENAAFYDVLPIKSRDITLSRFLTYLIMSLLVGVLLIIEILIFFAVTTNIGLEALSEMFELIKNVINTLPKFSIFISIFAFITSIIGSLVKFIASITIGSDKIFKNLGKFGPVLVFIIISVVLAILGITIGSFFIVDLDTSQTATRIVIENEELAIELSKNIKAITMIMGIGSALNLLVIGILMFLTNYFHKNRLTVA
ncbi:hypothetical protein [Anaerococcus porci]|uniref:hypothetical protein n=1 Tax=Anaerococcus porci TaxID=2652269 RepID=UPI002A74775A|nr:hypothetical protein [Anaerococcus porci]MDY3007069.1 hypothetical protein [Anaerococcus porci]